jgi:hypothetical protein
MSVIEPDQLPVRPGPPARAEGTNPHHQVAGNAPPQMQEALFERARQLPGVRVADSFVSVPGARAFHLDRGFAAGPPEAFIVGGEFAHLHPATDGSLHLALPAPLAAAAYERGWGEPHPIAAMPMIYGPRDEADLEVVWALLYGSYRYALGS